MSLHTRDRRFDCEGCQPYGCPGHSASLCYQDTADIYSYYIDGVRQWFMGLDEMESFTKMLESINS